MATTQNTFTGNGSTTNYSFTFEYIKQADVKASLDGTATTAFTFANATTLSFNTAPANGVAIRIFRDTAIDSLKATFSPGSAIKAEDLNDNFTQNNFAVQETDFDVTTANTTADAAKTAADSAVATANTSNSNSSTAVSTANTASATANAADANATTALNNSRESDGSGGFTSAISKANTAISTANTASTNATAALDNSRESDGSGGFTSAISKANTAVSTANTASTNASNAVTTANAASAAVSNAVLFDLIADVSSIPGSPSDNDYIEVGNSTGIQSFTPLSGLPSGFTGAAGLTVRLRYDGTNTTWAWMNYFANDSESRYIKDLVDDTTPQLGGELDAQSNKIVSVTDPTSAQDAATKAYVDSENATQDTAIGNRVVRTSATGAAELPSGTTAQRDGSPSAGYIRFNSTLNQFEGHNGSSWGEIGGGGGATGGGSDQWALEHDNTITTSYSISSGKNVITAGPITINSGVTVTVPSGSNWTIV